jgi:HK97 family phage major capsid protein
MKTLPELIERRTKVLDEIDDILNTAKEAERSVLEDAERASHDELVAELDKLNSDIASAEVAAGDAERFNLADSRRRSFDVPNVSLGHVSPTANRSLDELLWATDESVAAGNFGKAGNFNQHSTARNAVEQVVVRNADGNGAYAPRMTEFLPEHRQVVRNFQSTVTDMIMFGLLIDRQAKDSASGFEAARSHRLFKDRWAHIMRAMDTDTSNEGIDWIPTGIGASLHEKVRAAGKVAPLFARINLPTNPWKWPIEGADATAYRVAEPTSDTATKVTASTAGTVAATFDAEILGGRVLFSKSLEADSALAILPYVERKLVQAFVDAEEKAILDGDTDGTHQDTDTQAVGATHASSSWDGLRKKALAQTVATATTTTALNLGVIRKAMGKWGANPADLAFIIGVSALHSLLADTNLLTVDKMGPQATILNGQIGSVFGVPVIVSEHVREDLNASGVNDGITATKTYNLCVNRNEWAMGQRTPLDIQVDDSIYRETYQRVAVGFMREDFQSIASAATNEDTAIAYNVTP